ncbi:MAG: hypothetical protein WC974_09330 [Thermoplasmata archaeon]
MKKPKLFFSDDSEFCHSLNYFREDGNVGMILTEALPKFGDGTFYCSVFYCCGSAGDNDCGKQCLEYKPRNGKNGRCRFSKNCYEAGSHKFKLTKEGLEEIK